MDAGTPARLAKLEGSYDSLKVVRPMLLTVVSVGVAAAGLVLTLLVFTVNATNSRLDRLEAKVDAIPARLAEEFRAMRAEMSAQTAAIAGAITAARQPAPPTVIVLPREPNPPPEQPRPSP